MTATYCSSVFIDRFICTRLIDFSIYADMVSLTVVISQLLLAFSTSVFVSMMSVLVRLDGYYCLHLGCAVTTQLCSCFMFYIDLVFPVLCPG